LVRRSQKGGSIKALKDRYLSTFTGKKFFPFAPHPHQIDIRDIAHGLSLLCRFSGQCPYFFSVAEHSIYVADNLKLEGLLHDASEAYLADLPRPVKIGLPEYIPARYATGYLGDIGVPSDPNPMDFSAWFEAYLGGHYP